MDTKTCQPPTAAPATAPPRRGRRLLGLIASSAALCWAFIPGSALAANCTNTITADVVVLDNPTVFNRLGAQNPNWITYALKRDVVEAINVNGILEPGLPCTAGGSCRAGNVMLRPDKRPRPLIVRSVAGSCLDVKFTNWLDVKPNPNQAQQRNPDLANNGLFNDDQVADRCAGFHATGVEVREQMSDDGSAVGVNPGAGIGIDNVLGAQPACGSGLVPPDGEITYKLFTPHEGAFVVNSYGSTIGSEQSSGNLGIGMFAQLNVQPVGARMYRSQVTEEEMRLATKAAPCAVGEVEKAGLCHTDLGQPILDYEALYPNVDPWIVEGKAGLPVLNMLTAGNELVHSDINAIIAGPNADGTFPPSTYPLESVGKNNPSLPNRLEPFREFSSVFHDEQTNSQVFPLWYSDPVLNYTLAGVKDQFMINFGSGGIGSEIISNRLRTGPMHDCAGCAYEEFFLASQTVGDPGLLVNYPANTGIEACSPRNIAAGPTDPNSCWRNPGLANGPIPGNYALYQEDPSNVHHSYTGDFAKFRNTHVGAFEQHIFHLHNHQWLFNPNDDNGNYLDAQEIMPGSGHTYELVFGGVGNRNKTAGDAIFHCHFYPHFAQGMWYHIRIQDTFEKGSVLAVSGGTPDEPGFHAGDADNNGIPDYALRSGQPMAGTRALPDGELPDGVPIPAIVPMPGKAMPLMPAPVHVVAVDRGNYSLVGGRTPPDPTNPTPDSSQAVVDYAAVAGIDGILGTADDVSPGFPFWLAGNECGVPNATANNCPKGTVGHRMPTPPLDMLTEKGAVANGFNPALAGGWDGGLPRNNILGYSSGSFTLDTNSRLDFAKEVEIAQPVFFPETGTAMEKVSMAYNAVRERPSYANNLSGAATPGVFVLNGADPVPGSPYNDPCIDDRGHPLRSDKIGRWFDGDGNPATLRTKGSSGFDANNPRTYKIANVQIDAVFNKVGYHYSQERIIALWEDVAPTIAKQRPPEPLVMRFNTFDCGKILHANLVPKEYELDDFQVRTPTDIIGQHIHLPKWDLTTGDGAANGWNYEDGTLAPGMVQERITAINHYNEIAGFNGTLIEAATKLGFAGKVHPELAAVLQAAGTVFDVSDLTPVATIDTGDPGGTPAGLTHLVAQPHPFFGTGVLGQDHLGARTTIQRILVDPIVNVKGVDRGLGLTFSHDHYGPSTFQQIGLYSTILAEPAGSTWVHNESGVPLNTRHDGGPTTWQAAILPPAGPTFGSNVRSEDILSHREFYFEMSDFQHAYEAGTYVGADPNGVPVKTVIRQPNPFDVTTAFADDLTDTWKRTVNPPLKLEAQVFPDIVTAEGGCPGPLGNNDPNVPRPCAEAINISHSSMFVVNYRNEPVALRVFDPNKMGPDGRRGSQANGKAGDLAFALQSRTDRRIAALNSRFGNTPRGYRNAPYCRGDNEDRDDDDEGRKVTNFARNTGDLINCDRRRGDPFTPIMRAYERDHVKIKIQVGATEEQHQTTVHGLKWLSNGSGFGASPNSGWRNFQSHGISEQFALQTPLNPDPGQRGNTVDYLYATDATRDGFWSGSWGLLRTYGYARQDLYQLPDNPQQGKGSKVIVTNQHEFKGVCPIKARVTKYDVVAVLANDVLPNRLGVTIPANNQVRIAGRVVGGDSDGDGIGDNVGSTLDPTGGTLIYNRRGTVVPTVTVGEGAEQTTLLGGAGPLNDPTAMMYVYLDDLKAVPQNQRQTNMCNRHGKGDPRCPVVLRGNAPVEPVVLRANAGDCIEVTLHNRLPKKAPDLAGWQDMMWVVNRDLNRNVREPEMHFFNNNLIRPSTHVGLHAQLVEYDASRDDGVLVGKNRPGAAGPVAPGKNKTYRWYAGSLVERWMEEDNLLGRRARNARFVELLAKPVEFGGTNLVSTDRVKQPQKGLFGALVIEPRGAKYPKRIGQLDKVPDGQGRNAQTRKTRAQVTVTSPKRGAGSGGTYRETLLIGHKITNLRWKDGLAIRNIHQNELGREGAEDSGHAGFNYGMEPSWFRFKLPPDAPFGNAGTPNSFGAVPNAHVMYANDLVAAEPNTIPMIPGVSELGDPVTPVFRATANPSGPNVAEFDTRMHVLNGASADRDGTYVLHGHVWQRDPFVCPGQSHVKLAGRCRPVNTVGSLALGLNQQAKYMGGEEGMGHAYGHWPILV
ncbi:MAG: hypothetical protein QNJ91_16245, partial [Gammaproteobacteria bacterium]|nr:hypothetical protein [Gammaproteobacteria bacterium]